MAKQLVKARKKLMPTFHETKKAGKKAVGTNIVQCLYFSSNNVFCIECTQIAKKCSVFKDLVFPAFVPSLWMAPNPLTLANLNSR